ncbi:DUF2946 family protein [Xylophilus sp.]|uniref:DUF2946 family protein n=1 Tax=Xylophilus sp. TaxID=2653893 RepID=UPI0013B5DEC4|nr:DUF2946 family protein [Xylophilus sp.]KAF1044134.1 MAG: hypothetical protein GAK38_03660 [Xylophilus sp.]
MDDIVRQAIAKWPHVPDCYGWLGLDARGRWYMRDDAVQARGPFPQARGSPLQHDKLIGFIHRNYEADEQGRWFFQNGPQRVYVELEATPLVWRIERGFILQAHTGLQATATGSLVDGEGRLYLASDAGLGIVHTQDMVLAAEAVENGLWKPEEVDAGDLPRRFGFVRSPAGRAR